MKIAVPYENGQIFQHFGHTEQFRVYTVDAGTVTAAENVSAAGSGHGALAGFLAARGVEALICGGIGGGAKAALAEAGIALYAGVTGSCDEAVAALLDGTLQYAADATCNHHDQHHGGEGDACGGHGHTCGGGCGSQK